MTTSVGASRHLLKLGYKENIVNLRRLARYVHLTAAGPLLWLKRHIGGGDHFSQFLMLRDDVYHQVGTPGQECASVWGQT
jgi:hypothetical protein